MIEPLTGQFHFQPSQRRGQWAVMCGDTTIVEGSSKSRCEEIARLLNIKQGDIAMSERADRAPDASEPSDEDVLRWLHAAADNGSLKWAAANSLGELFRATIFPDSPLAYATITADELRLWGSQSDPTRVFREPKQSIGALYRKVRHATLGIASKVVAAYRRLRELAGEKA